MTRPVDTDDKARPSASPGSRVLTRARCSSSWPGALAVIILCTACGSSTSVRPNSTSVPSRPLSTARSLREPPDEAVVTLFKSAARRNCPASYTRVTLGPASGDVLAPNNPLGILACRYLVGLAEASTSLAGAVLAGPRDAEHLVRLLDRLTGRGKIAMSCPVFGGRSDLFVLAYRSSTVRILLKREACIPVTNGSIERMGEGLPMRVEGHWPDEGLL